MGNAGRLRACAVLARFTVAIAATGPCEPLGASSLVAQELQVVRADGAPAWGPSARLVEEVRIGTLMGDEAYAFGMVGGVVALPDGTTWVGDRHLGAVRRYRADGTYIDQVGREGEGPGEFRYPHTLRVLPDGSVAVWDDGQLRVSRFDPDGRFLDSFNPNTFMIGGSLFEEFEVDRSGLMYVIASDRPDPRSTAPRRWWWIAHRPDGRVQQSVFLEAFERDDGVDPVRTVTAVSPLGYRVTGRNDVYALDLHLAPGRARRIERPWTPVRYARAERRERERLADVMSRRNGLPPRRVADHKPVFSRFRVDEEGRLWVQVHAPGYVESVAEEEVRARVESCSFFGASAAECREGLSEWREPVVFEVIAPEGRFLGRVRFPNRDTELMQARGRLVWVVETGAHGEEYVVRYRIEGG